MFDILVGFGGHLTPAVLQSCLQGLQLLGFAIEVNLPGLELKFLFLNGLCAPVYRFLVFFEGCSGFACKADPARRIVLKAVEIISGRNDLALFGGSLTMLGRSSVFCRCKGMRQNA